MVRLSWVEQGKGPFELTWCYGLGLGRLRWTWRRVPTDDR
jgi:hypothetical protein